MSENQTEKMFKELLLLKMVFGNSVTEGLERVEIFVKKHESKEYAIGLVGPYMIVTPKDAKDHRMEAVLGVDLRDNKVFIDQFGEYGDAVTATELYAQVKDIVDKLPNEEESAEESEIEMAERMKAMEDQIFASLEDKDKKFH